MIASARAALARPRHRVLGAALALLAAALLALWVPALSTPFWGDDYLFLQGAFASRVAGEPWWLPFWPDTRYQFWRPLGHEMYWRFVEGVLGGDARAAHAASLALWLVACASVGLFACALADALRWQRPRWTGVLAGAVYATWAIHFTPVHWTSSADSLFIVLWCALALAAWLHAPRSTQPARIALCIAIPVLQALALFSKESAVLLPMLMLCMTAFAWRAIRPGRAELLAWTASAALVFAWLALRARFVLPSPPQYELAFEDNVVRNAASLVAWFFNVPREALRMTVQGAFAVGTSWALGSALSMTAFIYLATTRLARRVTGHQALAVAAFVVIAYGPYFLLAWQSYEYYAQVAMILPAVLFGYGLALSTRAPTAALLLAVSSYIAVEGSRTAEYPGLIGRARWAEEQLASITDGYEATLPRGSVGPVLVNVVNAHRFHAIGRSGLAWRLGLSDDDVRVVNGCDSESDALVTFRGAEVALLSCTPWLGEDL